MTSKRGTLAKKIPGRDLTQALNRAVELMEQFNKRVMTAEMLLLAFVEMPDVEAHRILRHFSQERGFRWDGFVDELDRLADERLAPDVGFDFVADSSQRIPLSNEMLVVLDEGLSLAKSRNEAWCNTTHALAIMATVEVSTYRVLNRLGITRRAVIETMGRPSLASGAAAVDYVAQAKNGQLPPVYARDNLLRNLMNLLAMTRSRHVILTGPNGVGRQSLVLALAKQMATNGPKTALIQMNESALLDDDLATVQAGLRLARNGILFIPDIYRFFRGSRRYPDFSDRACNELHKAFLGAEVTIIGTATPEEYEQRLATNNLIVDHSQQFKVPPPSVAETIEILQVLRPGLESDYNLTITRESLEETARLAKRYYTVKPLPGSAVQLLHRACAMFKVEYGGTELVEADNRLDTDDVLKATSLLTGIPVTKMGADERERYIHMADHLHKRIIGQNEAVQALSRAVKMARVGLKDPRRPIGSFLFLGPTGVGKTELAKALAEFMFGTEEALITLDMSEYMDESSVNRLIGSPPGYVGHEAGGQLTDTVKKRPYSVILFDEVEKAAHKVFDVLLQVMEEGRLTSGQGETVSFSECVILMTSNIGSRYLADLSLEPETAHEAVEEELKKHFRPEFMNRLDEIIYFHALSEQNLRDILDLMLGKEEKLLAGRDLHLELTDQAKAWLLAQNEHPEWGARPLRRIIQKHLREPMADFLLTENPPPNTKVKVRVKQGDLFFEPDP